MATGRRGRLQLVFTALFTALGTALLTSYLLVNNTAFPGKGYWLAIARDTSEDTRGSNGAVSLASVHSPATSGPTELERRTLQSIRCRGMKAERVWPESIRCEGKTNCARRIAQGEGYSLPQPVLDGVQFLLLFVGIGRSGSSIVGSVLDAHPNAVVANQYQLVDGYVAKPALHSTKAQIFSRLVGFSMKQAKEKEKNFGKGYSLAVGNGTTHIDNSTKLTVIGDKGAGMFPALYVTDSDRLTEEYNKLKKAVGVPIKIVQVIRNPFDNIATEVIYQLGRSALRLALVKGEHPPLKLSEMGQLPECASERYFTQMLAISKMETVLNLDILRVHLVDLVSKPRRSLERMCGFLHLECTEEYMNTCEASIFSNLSQSRELVQWQPTLKVSVEGWIAQVPWLQRYSFAKD